MTPDLVHFTDEETYGKFLDLHELHDLFCNLKGVEVWVEHVAKGDQYVCCFHGNSGWTTSAICSRLTGCLTFQRRGRPWNTGGIESRRATPLTPSLSCRYLEKLLEYMSGYVNRTHPLMDQVPFQ